MNNGEDPTNGMGPRYEPRGFISKTSGIFAKLLFRWKGSLYKLIWPELIGYSIIYFFLGALYRWALNKEQQTNFEKIAEYCRSYEDLTSLSLVLGFYVTTAIDRWWTQYQHMPWPDDLALLVSSAFKGKDYKDRLLKRSFMRYIILSYTLTMSLISPQIKKRFPTLGHIVSAGLMTEEEKETFETVSHNVKGTKQWLPLMWAVSIISVAKDEKRLTDDYIKQRILDGVTDYRQSLQRLIGYDKNSIPLVFTQVVALAVYSFFLGTLMGRQFIKTDSTSSERIDLVVPFFTLLQFFFYVGWLKVAEALINPFGEDDEDFEMNDLLDRHLQMSFTVIEQGRTYPILNADKFWNDATVKDLPHTKASKKFNVEPYIGSASKIRIPLEKQQIYEEEPDSCQGEEGIRPESSHKSSETSRIPQTFSRFIDNFTVQYTRKQPDNQEAFLCREKEDSTKTPHSKTQWSAPDDNVA